MPGRTPATSQRLTQRVIGEISLPFLFSSEDFPHPRTHAPTQPLDTSEHLWTPLTEHSWTLAFLW